MKITDLCDEVLELEKLSTKVVSWYAHPYDATVRGPFNRWFRCDEAPKEYWMQNGGKVASQARDVHYCASAMNNAPKLARALKLAVEAMEYVVAHEKANLEMNADVHRHDRYRENMYWKVREALTQIESMV